MKRLLNRPLFLVFFIAPLNALTSFLTRNGSFFIASIIALSARAIRRMEFEYGDSGKSAYFAIQIENDGKKGAWVPLGSAIIP
jgi:hypothetical protein